MAALFHSHQTPIVGLDIGSDSVRFVEILVTSSGFKVGRMRSQAVKRSVENEPLEDELVDALAELLKDVRREAVKFHVGVNCAATAVKVIKVPRMSNAEIEEALRIEAKQHFSLSLEDSAFSYELMSGGSAESKQMRFLIGASPQDTIQKIMRVLARAGVKPQRLIPNVCALKRLGEALPSGNEAQCLVDIGQRYTELIVVRQGKLVFARKVPVSGNDLTRGLMGVLASSEGRQGLTYHEAEEHKHTVGIPDVDTDKPVGKITTMQMRSLLTAPLEEFVNEIGRCLDYYEEEAHEGKINEVLLLGGGAFLKGLTEFLTSELEARVSLAGPHVMPMLEDAFNLNGANSAFQGGIPPGQHNPSFERYGTALGLALTGPKSLNFIQKMIRTDSSSLGKGIVRYGIPLAICLALIGTHFIWQLRLDGMQRLVEQTERVLGTLTPEIERHQNSKASYPRLAHEPYWEDLLRELSNLVPNGIYLTRLSYVDTKFTIRGLVSTQDSAPLSDFVMNLEKGMFRNVRIVTSSDEKGTQRTEFELHCGVDL